MSTPFNGFGMINVISQKWCLNVGSWGGMGILEKEEKSKMNLPERQMTVKRKIAICSFQNRVCPRFDLTHELLIFDAKNPLKGPVRTINVPEIPAEKLFDMFAENKVEVVISGGTQKRFQEMFLRNSIDVIWGVTGEVDDVVEAYKKGILYSGIGRVKNSRSDR